MDFKCPFCGQSNEPKRKDTYWFCTVCGIVLAEKQFFISNEFEDATETKEEPVVEEPKEEKVEEPVVEDPKEENTTEPIEENVVDVSIKDDEEEKPKKRTSRKKKESETVDTNEIDETIEE